MRNGHKFIDKIRGGQVCLGTCITFTDSSVTEALSTALDFVWIDAEHNALTIETVQSHIMATAAGDTAALVRVAWNDAVLIKPVLDIGADGVIVPLAQEPEDVRRAVAACRYPPAGVRGFGPRRAAQYGRLGGPEFCKTANESVLTIMQIEHINAVRRIDEILDVPGLGAIVIGSNDLAGSMGLIGQPRHPDVLRAADQVIAAARRHGVIWGAAIGDDPEVVAEWAQKGAQWICMGCDYTFLLKSADMLRARIRGA